MGYRGPAPAESLSKDSLRMRYAKRQDWGFAHKQAFCGPGTSTGLDFAQAEDAPRLRVGLSQRAPVAGV